MHIENVNVKNADNQVEYVFGKNSYCWNETEELNKFFLTATQNFKNDILNNRGHVFLNEVFDSLGMPRTSAGQVLGWIEGPIIFDIVEFTPDHVNIRLNHEGYILDKLED